MAMLQNIERKNSEYQMSMLQNIETYKRIKNSRNLKTLNNTKYRMLQKGDIKKRKNVLF